MCIGGHECVFDYGYWYFNVVRMFVRLIVVLEYFYLDLCISEFILVWIGVEFDVVFLIYG